MTRKEAFNQGLTTYFTGKPCSHGHLTYRYVVSGSCKDCTNGNFTVSNPRTIDPDRLQIEKDKIELAKMRANNAAKKLRLEEERIKQAAERSIQKEESTKRAEESRAAKQAAGELIRIYVIVTTSKLKELRDFAYLLTSARNPTIRFEDVARPHISMVNGRPHIYVYPEDVPTVRAFAEQLNWHTMPSVIADREHRAALANQQLTNETPEDWPEGDPR